MSSLASVAQHDPTENLARQIGQEVTHLKDLLKDLERSLERLDGNRELLGKRGVVVDVDLGDVGNAAAAARRVVKAGEGRPTFRLPT